MNAWNRFWKTFTGSRNVLSTTHTPSDFCCKNPWVRYATVSGNRCQFSAAFSTVWRTIWQLLPMLVPHLYFFGCEWVFPFTHRSGWSSCRPTTLQLLINNSVATKTWISRELMRRSTVIRYRQSNRLTLNLFRQRQPAALSGAQNYCDMIIIIIIDLRFKMNVQLILTQWNAVLARLSRRCPPLPRARPMAMVCIWVFFR